MTDKPTQYQEIEERVSLYAEALSNYQVKKSRLIKFLLNLGYQYYDNIYGYEEVLISPQLLESDDWAEHTRFDDEDEVWHIDDLTSLPVDKGYTDWTAGYHIIDL